jgi:hypothetical protein
MRMRKAVVANTSGLLVLSNVNIKNGVRSNLAIFFAVGDSFKEYYIDLRCRDWKNIETEVDKRHANS